MDMVGDRFPLAEEDADDQRQRNRDHHRIRGDRSHGDQIGLASDGQGAFILKFLADKAQKGRNTGHREPGSDRDQGGDRHDAEKPAHLVDVACAGSVIDIADHQEERAFIEGVDDQEGDRGDYRNLLIRAQEHGDRAERHHRGPGKHQLQVALTKGHHRGPDRGDRARNRERVEPGIAIAERRLQARHQIEARFHHRCGMQVGADRCRCRHRIGQPEVERELRRFGESADQHQRQDRQVERMLGKGDVAFQNA
jgi:hypothetical protein